MLTPISSTNPSRADTPCLSAQLLGGKMPLHGDPQVAEWIIATPVTTRAKAQATITTSNCCQRFSRIRAWPAYPRRLQAQLREARHHAEQPSAQHERGR